MRKLFWVVVSAAVLLGIGAVVAVVVVERAAPDAPGPFYSPPSPLPDGDPGEILRQEEMESLAPGSTAHRVLYLSTDHEGEPAAASGVIYVPEGRAPAGGRGIVALNHGTTGITSNCAPSLITDPTATPAWDFGAPELLRRGWIVAATDYQGLGTPGPHPYVIGRPAGTDALDIVRAARHLEGPGASERFAVWGHSQGGHASMFTGQLASSYAPELELVGVAAAAPVPNLESVLETGLGSAAGRVMVSYALSSWSKVFDVSLDTIADEDDQALIEAAASHCLTTLNVFAALPETALLGRDFLTASPWDTEPWGRIIEANTPGGAPVPAPLLLLNGSEDQLVHPAMTRQLAKRECEYGEPVAFRLVPGADHGPTGHDAAPAVARWIAGRFAGAQAPDDCARLAGTGSAGRR